MDRWNLKLWTEWGKLDAKAYRLEANARWSLNTMIEVEIIPTHSLIFQNIQSFLFHVPRPCYWTKVFFSLVPFNENSPGL